MSTIGGARLEIALHVGLALGFASHRLLDVWQYGDVGWIPGSTLDQAGLSGHALL